MSVGKPKTVPCDKCDEPINLDEDMRYTIADVVDDDDNLISSRHGRCQPSLKELSKRTDEAFGRAMRTLDELKDMLK